MSGVGLFRRVKDEPVLAPGAEAIFRADVIAVSLSLPVDAAGSDVVPEANCGHLARAGKEVLDPRMGVAEIIAGGLMVAEAEWRNRYSQSAWLEQAYDVLRGLPRLGKVLEHII